MLYTINNISRVLEIIIIKFCCILKTLSRNTIPEPQPDSASYTLRPEVSNPSGSVVSTMFCKAKSATKKILFLRGDFRPLPNKNVQMWDQFFPLLFPKDSEPLKILDIWLREVGAKIPLIGTSKSEQTHTQTDTQTNKQTNKQTYGHFDL